MKSIGQLSDPALAAAYARATCVIVASSHEGFCLPVLEASFWNASYVPIYSYYES